MRGAGRRNVSDAAAAGAGRARAAKRPCYCSWRCRSERRDEAIALGTRAGNRRALGAANSSPAQLAQVKSVKSTASATAASDLPLPGGIPSVITGSACRRLTATTTLIVAPARCLHSGAAGAGARCWGSRCSSTRCVRRATGASATSATSPQLATAAGTRRRGVHRPESAACAASRPARTKRARTRLRRGCFSIPLYIDVEAVDDFADCAEARAAIARSGISGAARAGARRNAWSITPRSPR